MVSEVTQSTFRKIDMGRLRVPAAESLTLSCQGPSSEASTWVLPPRDMRLADLRYIAMRREPPPEREAPAQVAGPPPQRQR